MPGEEAHRGAESPGPLATRGDARVDRITDLLLEADPIGQSAHRPVRDSTRSLQVLQQRTLRSNPLTLGTVVHAVPHVNWYRVQMADGGGWLGCCRAGDANYIPVGPRVGNAIAPGSRVVVWKQPNIDFGVILGVIPHILEDSRVAVPSWLTQGSAVGVKREQAHRQPFKGMFRQGGIHDFSCQAPLDSTALELSWITETGLAFLLSPFEAFLRVNEMCGLWLNYFDGQTALAGWNLNITSSAHELQAGHDEGENRYRNHVALYPWESVGAYSPGVDLAAEESDSAVHYTSHKGKIDLPPGKEDLQPFYRVQEYKGYEGQGGLRAVVAPGTALGQRQYSSLEEDQGLFVESLGVDGAYSLFSAKQVIIGKRCKLEAPREIRPQEAAAGDDAASGNYRFSSVFGAGPEHRVGDISNSEETDPSLARLAGIHDIIAHACNWRRLHPFHYRADFRVPQESANPEPFARVNESLDFGDVADTGYLREATPVRLRIDHRYNEVEYFLRESFLAFLEDGSVAMGGGCGEEFTFCRGRIRMACPGGVEILPGQDLVVLAAGVVVKAQDSVDVSSSRKDVRVWAHENLQLGSNSSLLLESKGSTREQDYRDKVGEDVRGGGLILKSAGVLAALGGEVYLRSTAGDVTLDAGRMSGDVVLVASDVNAFLSSALTVYHFSGVDGAAQASHRLSRGLSHHEGGLVVGGSAFVGAVRDGNLTVAGSAAVTRNVACGGSLADGRGGTNRRVGETFASEVEQQARALGEVIEDITLQGDDLKTFFLDDAWYGDKLPGNDEAIGDLGFSYRDSDDPGKQYGTTELRFAECRWQQLARLGGGGGGESWQENPVHYQGRELHPWPGRAAWEGGGFVRLDGLTMYDASAGLDRDRPGPYEGAALGELQAVPMADGLKIIPHG